MTYQNLSDGSQDCQKEFIALNSYIRKKCTKAVP